MDWPRYYMPIWRHMGLLDARENPKPAFFAFKTMVHQLDGFETARRVEWGDGLRAYEFTATGGTTFVLWSDEEHTVDLTRHLPSAQVVCVDLQGQRTPAKAARVKVGPSPVFLRRE
jgi:hypothetical protein